MHCDEPNRMRVCPAGAISKGEVGIVHVDKDKCIGCKYCYQACPYGVPNYDEEAMDKCDCCLDAGIAPGETPYCVQACIFNALKYEPIDELVAKAEACSPPAGGGAPCGPNCYLVRGVNRCYNSPGPGSRRCTCSWVHGGRRLHHGGGAVPDRQGQAQAGGVRLHVGGVREPGRRPAAAPVRSLAISPVRGMMMWSAFSNFSSWMTYGAPGAFCALAVWAVSAALAIPAVGKRLAKAKWLPVLRAALAWVGIALGAFVAVYTGMLLMTAGGVPLWDSPLLPALFTVSAFDTGVALVELVAVVLEKGPAGAPGGRPHGTHSGGAGGLGGGRARDVPLGHALRRPRERLGAGRRGLRPAAHLGGPLHRVLVDVRCLRLGVSCWWRLWPALSWASGSPAP